MSADPATPRPHCAVLGSPIGHSLSPVLHRAAYAALDLDWDYSAHEVTEATLAAFVADMDASCRGLSLTMPLKAAVLGLCTSVSDLGLTLRSVNTVVVGRDGSLTGHNTDVPGLVEALREAGVTAVESGIVVGSGSTAASALAALAQLGATRVDVRARTAAKASRLVDIGAALGVEVLPDSLADPAAAARADVLVSTIPAEAQPDLAPGLVALAPVVLDVIYHPTRTPMLVAAEAAGATAVPGFALLLHQAAHQVRLMTGRDDVPLEAMRAAGARALASR